MAVFFQVLELHASQDLHDPSENSGQVRRAVPESRSGKFKVSLPNANVGQRFFLCQVDILIHFRPVPLSHFPFLKRTY